MTHIAIEVAPGITRYIAQGDPEDAPRKTHKMPPEHYLAYLNDWRTVQEFAEYFNLKYNAAGCKLNTLLDMGCVECDKRNVGKTRNNYYRMK